MPYPRIIAFAALAAIFNLLGACSRDDLDDEETELDCSAIEGTKPVSVTLFALDNSTTVTADLRVTGSATHNDGLAIRSLSVLGVPAENTGFNFDAWQATVPLAVLRAQTSTVSDKGNAVELTVTVTEPCTEAGALKVDIVGDSDIVYIDPSVELGTLDLSLDATYLAPRPGASTTLTITSTPPIKGARVQLEAVGVLFDGIADRTTVRLDAEGRATVEVRATRVGQTSIVARSDQDFAGVILEAGGKPVLSPSLLTLKAGESAYVSGRVEGDVGASIRCTVSPSTYATIRSNEGDFDASAEFDLAGGDVLEFVIEAADVVMPELFTLSCVETKYNQVSNTVVVTIE